MTQISSTWYETTAQRGDVVRAIGSHRSDAVVIGGGLAGLTTALELQRRGRSVILFEAERIAWAASGRNGGFVSNGFAEGMGNIEKRVGLDHAKILHGLSKRGTEYVRETIAQHDPSIKMGDGWMVVQRHPDNGSFRSYGENLQRTYGEPVSYLPRQDVKALLLTERYHAGLTSNAAFHIHPLRYALLLHSLAAKAGAKIFEHSKVLSVEKTSLGFRVKTHDADVTCNDVVYCVSSLDPKLHAVSGRAVLPVATYVAVTKPHDVAAIQTSAAIADTRRAGDYYRKISDSRILWGGRITTKRREPMQLAQKMQGDMTSVYPQLRRIDMEYAWMGLMGYALHKMPLIGTDGKGQWFATAFGGHGLNTTAMAGQLVAGAIANRDDSIRAFASYQPQWAMGPLGQMGVQGAYWWMQIKDRIEEPRA